MEMMIIAVVAIVAFAAVLIPLFRRGTREVDAREFEGDPAVREPTVDPARGEGVVPPMAAGPATPVNAGGTTLPQPVPRGDLAVPVDRQPASGGGADDVELEVQRYRAAVRAGTVCTKCGQANPADSKFCFECGAALPLAEAREFD
jgi:hypothetical protein